MNEVKILVIISVLLLSAVFMNQAFAVTTTNTLYACTPPEGTFNLISIVNLTNGKYISNVTMTVAGLTLKGCNGMAVDPTTGIFYTIVTHTANTTDRHLVSFDPDTGVGTDIGAMGDRMATLGFLADGSLRTVTGIASPTPEIYHSVDKTTGQTTVLCPIPATPQDEGQTLSLNFDDDKIYHLSGRTTVTNRLATVDIESPSPTNCGETNLGQTQGHSFGESMSLAYNTDDGLFYGYGFNSFYTMNTTGFATLIQSVPNPTLGGKLQEMKGLAFSLILAPPTPVKQSSANPSSAFPVPERGGQQSISQLSDVQPLTQPAPAPSIDRAFDLFATLNQLFAPTEPITPTVPTAPTPPSLEQVRQESFIEAIQSFFASLFG